MYEQQKSEWTRLSFLLFGIGFTGSVSMWQGGFAAWFLFIGSVLLLLPGIVMLVCPMRITVQQRLVSKKQYADCLEPSSEHSSRLSLSRAMGEQRSREGREQVDGSSGSQPFPTTEVRSGELVEVHWDMHLDSLLPIPWLLLSEIWRDANGNAVYHARKVCFPWFQRTIQWSYKLPRWSRGVYASHGGQVTTGDFPGLVLRKGQVSHPYRLVVWPRIPAVSRGELGVAASAAVRNVAVVPEESEWSADRRPYRPGDSFRQVDWRASARASSWLVREREWTRPARVWVLVDKQEAVYATESGQQQFEAVIEMAAALLHTWDHKAVDMVLAVKEDGELLFAAGSVARQEAMAELAEAVPNGQRSLHQRLTRLLEWIRPGDRVIVITPQLNEALLRSAGMVQQAAEKLQLWIPQCEQMPTLKSRWEEWNGRAEGLDIVRCMSMRKTTSQHAGEEPGGIARA